MADPHGELDRQVARLLEAGVAALAGVTPTALRRRAASLHDRLDEVGGRPFALVLPGLAPADRLVSLTETDGKHGFTTMQPDDLVRFRPIADVEIPASAYLLVGPETGREWLDVPPAQVLPRLLEAGRTPLTLEEGLALVLQDGRLLRSATCFSMLASRCGDKRVPALWVSKSRPRLGWCWEGAPHTWLGSASAAARIG